MPELNTGDTAWVLGASALVLFMTPGLAFFYAGMTRAKSALGMLMLNVYCMGIVPIVWALVAYTLAFSGDWHGLIGDFDFVGLRDIATTDLVAEDIPIPVVAFIAFQLTFAVITPALMSGAVADRIKFAAWAVFIPIWLLLVYTPIAHWVFGGGWAFDRGALDFAGGAVVHMNAGAGALALVIVLGRRQGWPNEPMHPHSLVLTMIGTGILWFGWFGFNAGSALGANNVAAEAFLNTFLAAAAGMIGWLLAETFKDGYPTTLGAASGVVAGLVAVTPAAGFVGGLDGIIIGLIAGVICFMGIQLKHRFNFDDSLDVVGIHGVGGLVGALSLGFLADASATGLEIREGLFFGGGLRLLGEQALVSGVVLVYSFVVTFIIAKVLDMLIGLRVDEDEETRGLDVTQHAESAYNLADIV